MQMMAEVGIDGDGPTNGFELGDSGGAKPRPVEVGGAVVGFGEKSGGFMRPLSFCSLVAMPSMKRKDGCAAIEVSPILVSCSRARRSRALSRGKLVL